jgi:hypothetical protein
MQEISELYNRSAPSPNPSHQGLIFTHNPVWMRPQGKGIEGVGQRRYRPW